MKTSARVLIFACLSLFLFVLTASKTHAASPTPYPTYSEAQAQAALNTESDVPINIHTGAQIILLETISAISCQLAGYDPTSPNSKCLGVNPQTGKIGFVENGGGMLAVTGKLIDYTFVPPATSGQYIAYIKGNFGLVKPTYAQFDANSTNPCDVAPGTDNSIAARGVGFCGLEPILQIWVTMRNIVYLILILVFVVIGLGIMLRIHIDPRTVMTIQNQIPKIIIGIVAITFSFAIAGFLIDVMWVTIYLFAGVLTSATNTGHNTMLDLIQAGNPFDAANAAFNFSGNIFNNGILGVAEETSKSFGGLIQNAFESGRDWGPAGDLLGGIVSGLAFIVIVVAMISALLRLWVALVFCYINIILDVIFAPFWILSGLIPGSSLGLGGWIRDLMANLAVFPVAIGFFILGNYLVGALDQVGNDAIASRFVPPLMGGQNATAVAALIGFGFVLMLPSLLNTIKAAFKTPKLDFGPIFKPVSAGAGFMTAIPKKTFEMGQKQRYYSGKDSSRFDNLFRMFGNPYYNQGPSHGPASKGAGHQDKK